MKKQTRTILQELNTLNLGNNKDYVIESTANNIINSCINLVETLYRTYDEETANRLEKRFFNSIKTNDPMKFKRGIQKIIESKEKKYGP